MIKLVYIRGISAYDTPYFSSKVEQDDFFNDISGEEIDAYYPPHYTNTIKFDVEDVSDMSQYNYLILYTDNKTYYYFIQSIEYINESLYEITIVMDTIQTYMFDIVWNESLVSRKSIKRWNNDKINRDYIRENLSQTSKKLDGYSKFNTTGYFIIHSRFNYTFDINNTPTTVICNNKYYSNGSYYYLIPIPENHGQVIRCNHWVNGAVLNTTDIVGGNCFIETLLATFVQDPYTLNIFYVNNLAMTNKISVDQVIDTSTTPYTNIINFVDSDYSTFSESVVDKVCIRYPNDYSNPTSYTKFCGMLLKDINLDWFKYQNDAYISLGGVRFSKNQSTSVDFNKIFIPQLIDENYIEFAFGERMCSTNFPLHYAVQNEFNIYCSYDLYSGFRNYKIQEKGVSLYDVYLTTTVCASLETLDLYTDAWETYQAQHKGDLTIGIASQRAKNVYNGVASVASSFGTHNTRTTTFDSEGIEKSSFGLYGVSSNRLRAVKGITDTIVANASIQAELMQLQDNMQSTPDTSRCGNEFYNDFINNSLDTIATIMVSEDIESVARKLEYHGYKICEYIKGNLFEECKIRYYYNVIKVENMYIDLSVLTTSDILFEIKARFMNGLRLWDMEHNTYITEGLKYDNVELEEL